jgi:predicted ATPase/uncharacterized protein HemY/DNA-binding XRE family transcriptional regulator
MSSENAAENRSTLQVFGDLLKRLRLEADLTQEELAERASVSARLISDLEREALHRPRRDTVQLLADALCLRGAARETFVALGRGKPQTAAPEPSTPPPPRLSLPRPATPIVGRLRESAAALTLVLDADVRLLTMTGPGGAGKTRLALDVAFKARGAFAEGVVFVDLAPVRDAGLVLATIAQALDVQPGGEQSLRDVVIRWIKERRFLLVLDNFEHVSGAAPVVAELLATCSGLTILATSRAPLHIRAEHLFTVGPLILPDLRQVPALDDLARIPAVELFLGRAQAVRREFFLTAENSRFVAEIVVRLDGLPLAIELAALRMKTLSPAALLDHLDRRLPLLTGGFQDLPARQRALRATLDWSHELLSQEERHVFSHLAVFAGGCTLEAAEFVAEVTRAENTGAMDHGAALLTLEVLSRLVDANLLRVSQEANTEPRFRMLETIREYGLERLTAASGEKEACQRHLAWFLALVERAEPELIGAKQGEWFARLALEHDNVRAALTWAIAHHDAESALRLTGALYRFWATHGYFEEGRRWLEAALALDNGEPSVARGNVLLGLGVMTFFQGEYDRAESLWRESLELFRSLHNLTGVAYSFGNLGLVADAREDYERATTYYESALALFRQLNSPTFVNFMLHNLGLIAYFQGEYERATGLFEETLAWVRSQGDANSIAMTLGNLGLIAFAQGDYARALEHHRASLTSASVLTNKPWLVRALENFALVATATGDAERAIRLFATAAAQRALLGTSLPPNDQEINERHIARARAQLGDTNFSVAWRDGEALPLEEALDLALETTHEGVPRVFDNAGRERSR